MKYSLTLAILWKISLASQVSSLGFKILATDVDLWAIERAQNSCYPGSSLTDLPAEWRTQALSPTIDGCFVKPEYREPVTFVVKDMHERAPDGPFHLILCRTSLSPISTMRCSERRCRRSRRGWSEEGRSSSAALNLSPEGTAGFEPRAQRLDIYRQSVRLEPGAII